MVLRITSIILLGIITMSCASSLPPAEPAKEMMDQADKVILTIDDDPERAFQRLRTHLLDNGFSIQRVNMENLMLQTGYQKYGATFWGILGGYSMRIFANITGYKITFTGQLSSGTYVENSGGKNSPMKSGWREVVRIAEEFPHTDIYFSRNL